MILRLTLQAEELPKVVHTTNTPFSVWLDTHDLVQSHDMRCFASTESIGGMLSSIMQDIRELCVFEATILIAAHT